jgi:hypothetical protein
MMETDEFRDVLASFFAALAAAWTRLAKIFRKALVRYVARYRLALMLAVAAARGQTWDIEVANSEGYVRMTGVKRNEII